jgi:DNA-directed RNA polymerase specialized sigma24 family protein
MSTTFGGGREVPDSDDVQEGLDAARQALTEQLERIDEQLQPYEGLVQAREQATAALAALEGGKTLKKRVSKETIAVYVEANPGSKVPEIAAGLEIPAKNVYPHLDRNRDTMFDKLEDGRVYVRDGWEAHRRKAGDS